MLRNKRSTARTGPASSKRSRLTPSVLSASTVKASTQKRIEVKRRPDAVIINQIDNTWRLDRFPLISAGDGSINRDGRAIKILGYEHRIVNQTPGNGATRFVYVLWNQPLSPPVASSIFDIVSGAPHFNATYNVDQAANYTILGDYIHRYENTSPAIDGNEAVVNTAIVHTKKLGFIQTYFGSDVTDICDKVIYVFSVNMTGTSLATLSQASVSFIDI